MKKTRFLVPFLTAAAFLLSDFAAAADAPKGFEQAKPLRIALVNFKTIVEKSKMGKKEQAAFDAMKKQMETILEEKEKALTDVAEKFNDMDYLDSISPETEAKLKREFRTLNQEYSQQQSQFYQTLSQTNMLVIQRLTEEATKASEEVAKANSIDIVLNSDSAFYAISTIDISDMLVRVLDEKFDKESKEGKQGAAPTSPSIQK